MSSKRAMSTTISSLLLDLLLLLLPLVDRILIEISIPPSFLILVRLPAVLILANEFLFSHYLLLLFFFFFFRVPFPLFFWFVTILGC